MKKAPFDLRKIKKTGIYKIIGVPHSPSPLSMQQGKMLANFFNLGIMQQMLQEIEQQRGKLPAYCFDNEATEHEIAEIVRKHDFYKFCFDERLARFDA